MVKVLEDGDNGNKSDSGDSLMVSGSDSGDNYNSDYIRW